MPVLSLRYSLPATSVQRTSRPWLPPRAGLPRMLAFHALPACCPATARLPLPIGNSLLPLHIPATLLPLLRPRSGHRLRNRRCAATLLHRITSATTRVLPPSGTRRDAPALD